MNDLIVELKKILENCNDMISKHIRYSIIKLKKRIIISNEILLSKKKVMKYSNT